MKNYRNINYVIVNTKEGDASESMRCQSTWTDRVEEYTYPVYDVISLYFIEQEKFDQLIENQNQVILIHQLEMQFEAQFEN